ncbi:hypothetical protein EV385_4156 [Krasilnikovia cinnamomea]|uniref:Uncharacterized protein n=1 Tax=Krasilnikovia cinnamomea TaxID=349313 RepID=A0A4V2G7F1_9ACTN|nr:hypothetical protein [Krasilnikovia cinnamomea]RZU52306.1 hypothetical protein EV385_4156 [Krasilnikovia cinnamomea]
MKRLALILAVAGALVAPATPASAHGGDAPDATAYRVTVSGVTPPEPGLTVRAMEAGARLELINHTGHPVEVLGYSGEPYLEVRPDGTFENLNAPTTYLNRTLAGDTPVPAGVDPAAPPRWARVSAGPSVRWHDRRARWLGDGLPPAAAADPTRTHRISDWAVPLRAGTRTFAARGTVDWVPPPRAWLWWLGAALLAVAVAAAGRWHGRAAGALAVLAGGIALGYATSRALAGSSAMPPALVAAALAVLAGTLALTRRAAAFPLALGGVALALFAGVAETGVWRQAVVDAPGPAWSARAAVLVALGAGLGTAVTGVAGLRRRSGAPAKVDA